MNGLYVIGDRTYLNVDLEKIEEQYGMYTIDELSVLNKSLSTQGLCIVKDDENLKVEVIDIDLYKETLNLYAQEAEKLESVLLQDLSTEQKNEVTKIIREKNLDISIDEIETGNDLWEATKNEVESAQASDGSPTDDSSAASMFVNIMVSFIIDRTDLENSILIDTGIENAMYKSVPLASVIGSILVSSATTIEVGLTYIVYFLGLEFIPVPGARIIATLGVLISGFAVLIQSLMYSNPAEDITSIDKRNKNIQISGSVIDIDYENIKFAVSTFSDILNTYALTIKIELARLISIRESHIVGAAERLKYYYLNNVVLLTDKIVDNDINVLYDDYRICATSINFLYADITFSTYACYPDSISVTRVENSISVSIIKYYDSSNGSTLDEERIYNNGISSVTKEQKGEIKSLIKQKMEEIIMDYDFLTVVREYANNSYDYGITIYSYNQIRRNYMSIGHFELVTQKIDELNNLMNNSLYNVTLGSERIMDLDDEIGSGWYQL